MDTRPRVLVNKTAPNISRMTLLAKWWCKSDIAGASKRILSLHRSIPRFESRTLWYIKHMSESTAAAPAIPLAILLPLMSEHCLSARSVRMLEHDEHFQVLHFRSHQIYYVHNFVTSTLSLRISISALARAFNCKCDRGTSALEHGLEPPETRGRHLGLAKDHERELLV
jgi:hypothetical protein